ncbi:hypothetical protein [Aquimarina macrocephali]|uniref:hypothetical protein n=1 Tax=Aquimarina macrocephali TaxID=666563 RepID=UPI003F66F1AD
MENNETKAKTFPKNTDRSNFALVEITLIKDHGNDKKGTVLKRHPNTADMLILKKIAKK